MGLKVQRGGSSFLVRVVVHSFVARRVHGVVRDCTVVTVPKFPDRPFRASEALASGASRQQLRLAVADGVLAQVFRGVYVASELAGDLAVRAAAASLILPEHAVVSDHTAAWLHGIDTHEPGALDVPPPLYVVSKGGADRSMRPGLVAGKRDLTEDEVCLVDGVPVTTPLRTAADLACLRGRSSALAVLDAFMREHGLTHDDYASMVARFRGRRGVRQFRELAPHATRLAESMGESWTRSRILDAGLPVPTPQVWVDLAGFGRVRLDLAYPRLKIAVEYDGEPWHTSEEQRETDRKRRQALRAAGWIVIVVTKADLRGTAEDAWLGALRQALAEREPDLRRRYPVPPLDERRPRRRR